jgi:hypothetical protein
LSFSTLSIKKEYRISKLEANLLKIEGGKYLSSTGLSLKTPTHSCCQSTSTNNPQPGYWDKKITKKPTKSIEKYELTCQYAKKRCSGIAKK